MKKTLVIIVLVLVVAGGLYFGISNWLKGRSARQAQDITNGAAQPGSGMGTAETGMGGEAVKTPEDLFKETKEISLSSKTLQIFKDVRSEIDKVFGESKVTSYGTYYSYSDSFEAALEVPRVITPEDLTKLDEVYLNQGFETMDNSVSVDSGTLTMSKDDGTWLQFDYYSGIDGQSINVRYTPAEASN